MENERTNHLVVIPDTYAEVDKIGYAEHVAGLVQMIKSIKAKGSFTIGIFGEWGQGKTSILRQIEKAFEEENRKDRITVWFNPWSFAKEKHLIIPFFHTLIASLKKYEIKNDGKIEKQKRISELIHKLRHIAVALACGLEAEFEIPHLLTAKFNAARMIDEFRKEKWKLSSIRNRKRKKYSNKDYGEAVKKYESMYYNLLGHLRQITEEFDTNVVVFIDDLDRCLPEKSVDLLESLKVLLDLPKFVFVIAVAREVIEEGIYFRYKKSFSDIQDKSSWLIFGRDYLDKIIQFSLAIPPVDIDRLRNHLLEIMCDLREATPYIETIMSALGKNPRKLKRFLNNISYALCIAESQDSHDVDFIPELLIKMTLIAFCLPNFYKRLGDHPEYVMAIQREIWRTEKMVDNKDYEQVKIDKATREDWLKPNRKVLTAILRKEIRMIEKTKESDRGFKDTDEVRRYVTMLGPALVPQEESVSRPKEVPTPIIHNLPYPSMGALFKGREDILERLASDFGTEEAAAITQIRAIHGLGGVGKTRLAVEYAWSTLEDGRHTTVFFVVGDTVANLNSNLAALAGPHLLNLPEQESPNQSVIIDAVLRELGRLKNWLLIIDNLGSDEAAERLHREVLPRLTGGNVLITSRRSNWPDGVIDFTIDKLDEADAAAYLLEKTKDKRAKSAEDEELAGKIARELYGLPVALEQAALYICGHRIGFHTYLEDFEKARKKAPSWSEGEFHYLQEIQEEIQAVWRAAYERLHPTEQAILRLASFLAPNAIPTAIFESQPERLKVASGLICEETELSSQSKDEEGGRSVRSFLAELAGWSMIILTGDNFTIHRLFQDSTRFNIPKDKYRLWCNLALELVNQYVPAEPRSDDVRSWDIWKPLYSHVEAIVEHADGLGISKPTTRLMSCLAVYYNARARFNEAEPLMRRALEVDEQCLGKYHPNIAIHLNNLGLLLKVTNRLAEAERLCRRALEIDEKCFGNDHPKVATYLNNLGLLLKETNRLAEAEQLCRRALEIDERCCGNDHPKVATHLNNLGLLLKETNRLAEAEQLCRRALEIDEKYFGNDHPKVATHLNNLGLLLKETDRLTEAEQLCRRALEIDEKYFGNDHPKVATHLNNLGLLLEETNRLAEAERLYRRALEIDEKYFGNDHPKVATHLSNLALLLKDTNRLAEAERLCRRALEIDEKCFGSDHPKVATHLNNLGLLLKAMNHLADDEAGPLMRRALKTFENSLGPNHPSCQAARKNLESLKNKTDTTFLIK